MFSFFVGSNPDMGWIEEQDDLSTLSAPAIMYGPDETMSRP